jgi:two-component system, NtrC family, nitrogen regulation sensor histidine kinase NtrY
MPLLSDPDRRKRNLVIICGLFVVVMTATVVAVATRAPAIPVASNIFVFALFNLNLIVFLLLLVLLFRNLVKLYFERRQRVVGSRFKTKLVLAFLSLALAPAILIFIVASNFINTSIEGWFKPQVERPIDQALSVAQSYYRNLEITALRQGLNLARAIGRGGFVEPDHSDALNAFLADRLELLGLTAVTVFDARGEERGSAIDPLLGDLPAHDVSPTHLRQGLGGHEVTTVREVRAGDLIQAVVPVWSPPPEREVIGAVAVTIHVSQRLEAKVRAISQAFTEYKQLKLLKNPVKGIYILLFLLLTLIIVFSFSWFGLYVARRITGPLEQLVAATHEVAAGNLNHRVEASADDEIGLLVESFNGMTHDLSHSKARLEEAYQDLQAKHSELEGRRRYTETVLEAVATGVVSFDSGGRLTTMNRAATRMLGLPEPAAAGRSLDEVLAAREFQAMATLIKRGVRRNQAGTIERELRLRRDGAAITLLASATALRGPDGEYAGVVFVLEDLTELLRAQRQAAWREVAQRIAHEIKNPLTPIQLSAQRLKRRLADRSPDDRRLLEECTGTIIQEVDGLKHLVNEFSRFARMPALRPKATDLRPLVENILALYREAPAGVAVTMQVAPDFPLLEVDPDQIKRALLNLVDNAVEATGGAGEVSVELAWASESGQARITVSDNGSGIAADDKDKLFVPYFSTKTNGMGLGLPIVHQIVSEHGGSIRVEDNPPHGSRFIVELPVATIPVPAST